MAKKSVLVGDFETCAVNIENTEARVWSSCLVEVDSLKTKHLGNDIEDFMEYIKDKKLKIYFHNLGFDGKFILPFLLTHNFTQLTHTEVEEKKFKKNSYYVIADEMGVFYGITIYWKAYNEKTNKIGKAKKKWLKTEIFDSYKILPMSVKNMGEKFLGLEKEEQKGKIDYTSIRLKGYKMTKEEEEYIVKDCVIVCKGLKAIFDKDMDKMTVSANAFNQFLQLTFGGDKKKLQNTLPVLDLETDNYIRGAYKGGWCYTNDKFKGLRKDNLYGVTLDVTSLYPSRMYYNPMPYGTPVFFTGEYKDDKNYPLFIQKIYIRRFMIKEGYFPCIQIKNSMRFSETEYLKEGEEVELTVTNIDLQLIKDSYHLIGLEYIDGYMFKSLEGLFTKYIDHFYHLKQNATNEVERGLAKLMLNSLYGKFASKMLRTPVYFKLNDKGILTKDILDNEEYAVNPYYTPIGAFITAYARDYTIRGANANYNTFMYADTDSLHLNVHLDDIKNIDLNIDWEDKGDLGLWKIETIFSDSLYLGAKKYMEYGYPFNKLTKDKTRLQDERDNKWEVKCAGLPYECRQQIDHKDKFKIGSEFTGSRKYKTVKNGVLLLEGTFKIRR